MVIFIYLDSSCNINQNNIIKFFEGVLSSNLTSSTHQIDPQKNFTENFWQMSSMIGDFHIFR
jgi:hypothetical protein